MGERDTGVMYTSIGLEQVRDSLQMPWYFSFIQTVFKKFSLHVHPTASSFLILCQTRAVMFPLQADAHLLLVGLGCILVIKPWHHFFSPARSLRGRLLLILTVVFWNIHIQRRIQFNSYRQHSSESCLQCLCFFGVLLNKWMSFLWMSYYQPAFF